MKRIPLVVGVQPCSFCYPVVYASKKGYFRDVGITVDYVVVENGSYMNASLAAKQLDIGVNGLATIYTVCSGVSNLLAEPKASGTGIIYARPGSDIVKAKEIDGMLGSKKTLKGVSCIGAAGTLTQQQAYAYMNKFGYMVERDFEFLNMEYSLANQAFLAGEGDIISADGLNYIEELDQAGMVRICDYATATESPYCSGIVSRRDMGWDYADDVTLFLKVFYETADELMNNIDSFRKGYLDYALENGRVYTEKTVEAEISGCPLFTREAMLADEYVLGTSTISAAKFFADIGLLKESELENLKNIDTSFLNNALDLDVKAATLE